MIGDIETPNGETVELYAEYEAPDDLNDENLWSFEDESEEALKDEIIAQAAKYGIPAEALIFIGRDYNGSPH